MNNRNSDTIIIIPALNEEESLPFVLRTLLASQDINRIIEIIVVDNGSTDATALVARKCGVMVIKEPKKGYGSACLAGLRKAFEIGADHIIFMDADFSDDPLEYSLLLKQLDQGMDLVIGSRFLGKAQAGSILPQALIGNKLAVFLMHKLFGGKPYTDLGPFRGMRMDALKQIQMQDQNFGWTIEMQIKAILFQLQYTEVSMSYRKRIGSSKITGTFWGSLKAGTKIIYCLFYYFMRFKILKRKA